jgi:superfamily II DNA/RNA helicase
VAIDTPEEINPDEDVGVTFRELGLDPKILKALDDMGYETPTPIQARAIPEALQNRDVLGIAQTGTGKTGAFTLPTVHKLAKGRARARMPRCLIVCPTRELAAQVAENVESYGKYLKLEMALIIGGVSFAEQNIKLNKGVDVLIATPGRLLDQFERGKVMLTGVQTLVVDEADRMLDMGFIPDIERIFKLTPFTRQVLFFSATMPNEIKRLVDQFLHQPVTIQVARKNMTADTVRERIVRLPTSDSKVKRTAIRWLIDNLENQDDSANNGIIFCNRKRDVDIVAKSLSVHGYPAAPIHGDLAQSLRMQTLDKFKSGELKWLVASDVAARGLDIPDVSFVFNFDVPNHAEDYVHRIGRTGRAGKKGDAVMLVARLDGKNYDAILDMTKREEIEELDIPGVQDFAKDSGGRGRKGGKGRERGGRDRNRSRSGGRDRNRSESPREEEAPVEVKTESPKRSSDSRRRAAPKRKTPKSDEKKVEAKQSVKEDTQPKKPSDSRRRAAPKGRKKPEAKEEPREKPKPRREPKENPKPSRDSGRSNSRNKKRRGRRDELEPITDKGFGSDVPDFFRN